MTPFEDIARAEGWHIRRTSDGWTALRDGEPFYTLISRDISDAWVELCEAEGLALCESRDGLEELEAEAVAWSKLVDTLMVRIRTLEQSLASEAA